MKEFFHTSMVNNLLSEMLNNYLDSFLHNLNKFFFFIIITSF